jgi:uncharacterized protein (TIGR02145 family)/prepilin-type N-terminal cleavage/methylation domain-containing protein
LGRGLERGFTLVELIVVVTILAILWLISFISIQWFTSDARDAKRISDVSNLITKITMENSIWIEYSEIINEWWESYRENKLRINWVSSKNWFQNIEDPINREVLKENEENFTDPLNNHPYPFAYATGNSNGEWYNFVQLAYVSEKTRCTKLVWNYYEMLHWDSPSLFTKEWTSWTNMSDDYIIEDWEPIYDIWYTPQNGIDASVPWEITVTYNCTSYTIADKNLWASSVWIDASSYWDYYQWWRTDTTFTAWNSDWWSTNNSWWWENDTNTYTDTSTNTWLRRWPCPTGWHVPSTAEWYWLFQVWCKYRGWTNCTVVAWSSIDWTSMWFTWSPDATTVLWRFQTDLKMPLTGYRHWKDGTFVHQEYNGDYWSSSPYNDGKSARRLYFGFLNVYPQSYDSRARGFSVRCFKNY